VDEWVSKQTLFTGYGNRFFGNLRFVEKKKMIIILIKKKSQALN